MAEACSNRSLGIRGELDAETFLVDQGFSVIAKNFRFGRNGEIDLIVRKENLFVFAEVKTRTGSAFGGGVYAISRPKKLNLEKTARFFIQKYPEAGQKGILFRFDLLSVSPSGIEWIKDIIRW